MERKNRGQDTFRDKLFAIVELPLTLKRLVTVLERLNGELARYSRLPETLANLVEVGQDFNSGFYEVFGGKVRYHPRVPQDDKDDIKEGPGESDGP